MGRVDSILPASISAPHQTLRPRPVLRERPYGQEALLQLFAYSNKV